MSNPAYWPDQRKLVLWLAPPPAKPIFSGACHHHGLQLVEATVDEVKALAPEARVLLLPVARADAAFMKRARAAAQTCARQGVRLGLVMLNEATGLEGPRLEDVKEYYKAFNRLQIEGFPLRGYDYRWEEVAGELSRLSLQAGENRSLTLTGARVDAETESLLRQAFYDYACLDVQALDGGKSGARTFRISDGDTPPAHRPVVAKLSSPQKIEAERSNYLLIERLVPNRMYATLVPDRCRVGFEQSLVVYSFLERCEPLAARLDDVGMEYVDNLFGHTLRDLHGGVITSAGVVTDAYGETGCKLLRWTDALRAAAAAARLRDGRLPDVAELKAVIDELPRHDHNSAAVHGDLHVGNLFVPDGAREALIIDYGSVRSNTPVVFDPACLEVSLAFPPAFTVARRPIERIDSREALLAAYRYPLKPSAVRQAALGTKCSSLVRRVREIAGRMDPNPASYPIAVAACLLRYASHEESGSLLNRSLAYELAASLFIEAGAAMLQHKAKLMAKL